jgi:hypothetical protein
MARKRNANSIGSFRREYVSNETHLPSRPEKANPSFIPNRQSEATTDLQIKNLLKPDELENDPLYLSLSFPLALMLPMLAARRKSQRTINPHI